MTKIPFMFKGLKSEFMNGFAEAVGENSRILRERFVAADNVISFNHGRIWEMPCNTPGDAATELKEHGASIEFKLDDIIDGRVEIVFEAILQMTSDLNAQSERLLINTLSESTEKSGQVVDGTQATFPESMFKMLELIELPLDGKGELSMPKIIVHPSQIAKMEAEMSLAGTEFTVKFEALKAQKKQEAMEREEKRLARFERPKA